MSVCTACGQDKPESEFRTVTFKSGNVGLSRRCIECVRSAARRRYKTDDQYRQSQIERVKKRNQSGATKEWKDKNKDRWRELKKVQSERARRRKGMQPRAKRIKPSAEMIAEKAAAMIGPPFPPRFRDSAERHRWKMRNDPCFLLNCRMRVQLRKSLRGMKAGRQWEQLVGYTVHDLHEHLRRQLPKGYTPADFFGGRLHIDHIIPKSLFDVTKPEELAACWSLANMRPLPARKNLKKGAKRVHLL